MELRILRNFIAVVEEEGVSAAADALRISQPALSPANQRFGRRGRRNIVRSRQPVPARSNLLRRAA